ncbi:MAG: T9SS type A sorting domain-containing protein [Bacteroidetes bacterium]|nr:T9SS type A sorting domain-containing protein [Bacteroidota bacterium]
MTQIGADFSLKKPWDLHLAPDGYLWVTERAVGVVVRVDPETGNQDDLVQIPDVSSTAGQDGLLGMALHEDFLGDNPYVYLSYTHLVGGNRQQKIVRYTFSENGDDGSLSDPVVLIDNMPSSNDHNSGRMTFGPDQKLYYTIGDQGSNNGGNYCYPNLAQVLPTQNEIDQEDWSNYPGKILRLNLDGSIPADNPVLDGVQSHVYSYGHRNAQGIVFGDNGILYADEHGPNTDDEVNIITSGSNYGWPNVAGYQDDAVYDFCDWASSPNCEDWNFSADSCPDNADFFMESDFSAPNFEEPLLAMFAVPDDYDFNDPACGNSWMCRPNVAPSSIAYYGSDAIPSWENSLLVSSLKRGRIYRLKLDVDGTAVVGDTIQHFYTTNRYRDIEVSPDGKSFYVITDESGKTSDASGYFQLNTMANPGTILKFTLDETVSASQVNADKMLRVYPNPVSDVLFVELSLETAAGFEGELINASGQVVKRFTGLRSGTNELELGDSPKGVYFFRAYSDQFSSLKRVVIF